MNAYLRMGRVLLCVMGVVYLVACSGIQLPGAKTVKTAVITTSTAGVVPITTISPEARELYEKGLWESGNIYGAKANEYAEKAIALDPAFAMAYLLRGRTGRLLEDRQADINKAMELRDGVSPGERLIIEAIAAFILEADAAKREAKMKEAESLYPKDKWIKLDLGVRSYFNQNYSAAIGYLEAAIALDANFAPAYNMLGYSFLASGDYERAETAYKAFIRTLPDRGNPYDSLADYYMKLGRFDEAAANYQKTVDMESSMLVSHRKLGITYAYIGEFDKAMAAISKADENANTEAALCANQSAIARVHLLANDMDAAIKTYEAAAAMADKANLNRLHALYTYLAAWVCTEKGDFEKSDQYIDTAEMILEGEGISPSSRNNFELSGWLINTVTLAKQGQYDDAMAKAESIRLKAESNPNTSADLRNYYYIALGHIHLLKGDYAKASDNLKQSNMEDMYVVYLYAQAEAAAGNVDHARDLYEKVANWNQDSFGFALYRSRAIAALN